MDPRWSHASLVIILLSLGSFVRADTAAFDLPGPRVAVKVTRAGKTLPISEVPNLQPGDRLWVHPELPEGQSARYLLIASFLRGATNPPPGNWFTKTGTWSKAVREEGIVVTIPPDAQQALLFLAPETGGDFTSLRSAVRGKPGAFVRASQDLNRASLDRSRLDKYLAAVKQISEMEPEALHDRSVLLARSLSIKLDQECFDKPAQEQLPCLIKNGDQLVLDDGHSQSMVAALTSGPSSDLIGTLGSTKMAGGGAYSPYIGAFVDVARMMENFRTADYQYIPALALPEHDELNLKLNNPPSFHKPMSVLVVGLPAIEAAQLPPLRAVAADQISCLEQSSLVLPVEGAPLVFSTEFAHDVVLHVSNKSGQGIDVPARADAARGGFVIDTHAVHIGNLDEELTGTLRGFWGFQSFEGPAFLLRSAHSQNWTVPPSERNNLVVGRSDKLPLQSENTSCVEQVTVIDHQGRALTTSWKAVKPGELEVQIPLERTTAGEVTLLVQQYGLRKPDELRLQTYSEASHLDQFAVNADEQQGVLRGTRLDEVAGLELQGIHFLPAALTREHDKDQLRLLAASGATLRQNDHLVARVALKDGRVLDVQATIQPPRPKVILISKKIQPGAAASSTIRLADQDEIPQDGRLSFFLKTEVPRAFPRDESIEVGTLDDSAHVLLSLADGNLILQDSETVLAILDPLKNLGPSAFGSLRFRPVETGGASGDWQSLGVLVRLPSLKEIRCPESPDKQCTLSGMNLFLIDSVASDPQFTHSVSVPVGFVNSTLSVPRPNGTLLYIKLRDYPAAVNTVALPVLPE